MSIEQFEQELINHDWNYEMSDDNSVYKRGRDNYVRLCKIADESEDHLELFDKYKKEHNGRIMRQFGISREE